MEMPVIWTQLGVVNQQVLYRRAKIHNSLDDHVTAEGLIKTDLLEKVCGAVSAANKDL